MNTGSWRRISAGDPERVILAIDFSSSARPEAGYHQLTELLRPGREVWLTSQPEAAETGLLPVEEYLRWWRNRPDGAQGHVIAVTGYCVGAVFVPALAEAIARDQGSRPASLLIDPEHVVNLSFHRDFKKAIDTMSTLSAQERADHCAEALAVCEAAGDAAEAATQVVKLYEAAVGTVSERLGFDEDTVEDVVSVFRSYVSYLVAARQLDPEQGWSTSTALTSAGSDPGVVHAASVQTFPVGTEAMLADARVVEAVHRFLVGCGA
ncbi:hypothetical protein LTT66_14615 [Nocardia gipuzkoensis]|uniref:hypothetical protein n=1 Tax=Nocardia gipuzkoensis TaxID=2749991 RepID=UPI001E49A2AE|nr:hypothetical protein [Nocardia gipuzkoensis]UGT71265.1 hypothetical protein LTT66_14615 [Nocardia gipuzkoensis]